MRRFALLAAFLLAAPAAADSLSTDAGGWMTYANARFGTRADVPPGMRAVDPPSANGDGRVFADDQGASVTVYGSYAVGVVEPTFAAYKAWLLKAAADDGVAVSYKAEGPTWLVYSGRKGETVHYAKVVSGCGAAHHVLLAYPLALKARYDPIVARLAKSLSCRQEAAGRPRSGS